MAGSRVWTWMQSRAMNSKNWLKPAQFYSFLLLVCTVQYTHAIGSCTQTLLRLKAIIQLQAIAQTTSMVNLRKAAWKARAFHPQLCRENGNQQCNEIWNGNHSNHSKGATLHIHLILLHWNLKWPWLQQAIGSTHDCTANEFWNVQSNFSLKGAELAFHQRNHQFNSYLRKLSYLR